MKLDDQGGKVPLSRSKVALDDLRNFAFVVEQGSMSGAARRHDVPKASVSRSVARLEAMTGAPLFDRTGRGLRPTSLGEALIPAARAAVEAGRKADEALRAATGEPAGPLRIAASALAVHRFLNGVIEELIARYPGVRPELHATSRPVDPLEEDHDITLRIGRPVKPALVSRRILRVRLGLYAHRSALDGLDSDDPEVVRTLERIVVRMEGLPDMWTLTQRQTGETLTLGSPPILTVNDPTVAIDILRAGRGAMLLPRFWAERVMTNEGDDPDALIALLPDWEGPEMEIFAVVPPGRASVPAVRAFLDLMYARSRTLVRSGTG